MVILTIILIKKDTDFLTFDPISMFLASSPAACLSTFIKEHTTTVLLFVWSLLCEFPYMQEIKFE
jgi:hypothetical protein